MLGHDFDWANFHIVEVMSQPKFSQKRIGYLSSSICFTETTDVSLLTTNLFKKARRLLIMKKPGRVTSPLSQDFASNNQYEVGMAINCLANICNADLARDLVADIVALLNSHKPYVRKKAVLVLYKIFLKFPEVCSFCDVG